ncbi:DUF1513 domain-containing protein [Hoeflea sp. WL0058]|uniref:DUF1513 domain-containing protein n=1 Tax=Flavimaribacter sediminis TaxID=2865987 RepID=A0AAE2ZJI0_9HYPH|nr:DUF1513 domain-containing protein [Flavimaribacter sediminis]MBW8635670.1 DUF1513 domain-containing protein [Flavimaribacter sediminis]
MTGGSQSARRANRRSFLTGIGAGLFLAVGPGFAQGGEAESIVFASAGKRPDGSFVAVLFDENGREIFSVPLPDRGHDITLDRPRGRAVAFARRPGNFAVAFDVQGRKEPDFFAAPEGRHFYGHGAFTSDGDLLYATENDYDGVKGVIGVYDATDRFRRIGELSSYGLGPHEILLMPDGRTLAVANGGIETHPDFGREKLNLATMAPSLAFIDLETGDLLEKHALSPELHQLSIRHMDADANGRIFFGGQYEGNKADLPPLLGTGALGENIRLFDMPTNLIGGFRNYIGSVRVSADDATFAATSPKGGCAVIFDARSGNALEVLNRRDACGLSSVGEGFYVASENGVGAFEPSTESRTSLDFLPDNHLRKI